MTVSNQDKQTMSNWIISIAISVLCCALLFLVFAGYIMALHTRISVSEARLAVLQSMNCSRIPSSMILPAPAKQTIISQPATQPAPEAISHEAISQPAPPTPQESNSPAQ